MGQMASLADRRNRMVAPLQPVGWRGRSGHLYALMPERVESFALVGDALHLLALGSSPLWVGTARDVIDDADCRSRFRLALDCADRAFTLDAGSDSLGLMTTRWDLEGAEPESGRNAA